MPPSLPLPTPTQAESFALMLSVGLPPSEAIMYFLAPDEATDTALIAAMRDHWMRCRAVGQASEKLLGGRFEAMPLDQRIKSSIDKHYSEMAYFLYSHNYSELGGGDLAKAAEARKVLEAKLAGTSGKLDPLAQFWDDLKTNKVKLGPQSGKAQQAVAH